MALFARRSVQRALTSLSDVAGVDLRPIIGRLNNDKTSLAAEWEVMLLAAFARLGTVEHEPLVPGHSRRVDLLFSGEQPQVRFAVDITAVSDVATMAKSNPIDMLNRKMLKKALECGHSGGGFRLSVRDASKVEGKRRLALPRQGPAVDALLKRDIYPFVRRVAKAPDEVAQLVIEDTDADVHVSVVYTPTSNGISFSSHASLDAQAADPTANVLYNALHAKASQLRDSGMVDTIGVLVCDASCSMLRGPVCARAVHAFFDAHRSTVAFVGILAVKERHEALSFERPARPGAGVIVMSMYWNPYLQVRSSAKEGTATFMDRAVLQLPPLMRTPANAFYSLQDARAAAGSFYGGFSISGDRLTLSARTVLQLLAGRLPYEEFARTHRPEIVKMLEEGALDRIANIGIEKCEDLDDDWLSIEFARDAAQRPYCNPQELRSR